MTLRFLRGALLLALLPLAACDETSSGALSPRDAIADATAARAAGDFDRAATILQTALDGLPADAPVADGAPLRVELAVTVLDRDGLDLLDLDRIASYLTEVAEGSGVQPGASSRGGCQYADDPTATPFDPTGVEGYPEISANRETVEFVLATLAPIMPDALRPGTSDAAFCGAVDDSTDPVSFNYDAAAAEAQLRAIGLTDDLIGSMLAVNALSRFTLAYLDVTEGLDQQTTWYRLDGGGIGICADDEDALEEQARTSVADVMESLFSLDLRASTFAAGSAADDLLEVVTDAFEEIRDGFGDYCDTV